MKIVCKKIYSIKNAAYILLLNPESDMTMSASLCHFRKGKFLGPLESCEFIPIFIHHLIIITSYDSINCISLVQSYQDYESRVPIVHADSNVIGNQKSSKEGHVPIPFLSLDTLKILFLVEFCGIST